MERSSFTVSGGFSNKIQRTSNICVPNHRPSVLLESLDRDFDAESLPCYFMDQNLTRRKDGVRPMTQKVSVIHERWYYSPDSNIILIW